MEGASVLLTDFGEGICFSLLEFLIARRAIPYVLIKDFENIHEVYETFPAAIPIVLDFRHSVESAIDHMSALPTMSCIFNFDGETLENLYRQSFEHFHKSISTSVDHFDGKHIYNEITDAISDGYTLIVNYLSQTVSISTTPTSVGAIMVHANPMAITKTIATTNNPFNSSRNLKFIFEKLFFRHPEILATPKITKRKRENDRRLATQDREGNSISDLFKKMLTRFNPCSTISVMNFLPARSSGTPIKSPEEINKYIKEQQDNEIKIALQTIHESALTNWSVICEEKFQFTPPEYEEKFTEMCQEIERKGEEGRKALLDKVNKDIERTKQWDHVLGAKTIARLLSTREREIEGKVQQFCKRKMAEARQKVNEEIQENKNRTKARFYSEILDEQVMELMRIKAKYEKRKELLMLPYTGELKLR